jgi:broad specificity phosphatase PhoE
MIGPSRIILIRHAEKTGEPNDPGLSDLGTKRAMALATTLPGYFGEIDAIFAAKSKEKSVRPFLTVKPISEALGISIDERWDTRDVTELAAVVLTEPQYRQKQVLISWRHEALPKLARALGAATAGDWPSSIYERIWVLSLGQALVDLQTLHQRWVGDKIEII